MSDSLQNWSNIPTELLQRIFRVYEQSDWKNARGTLYECQLVCKVWSKASQAELYRTVYLPAADIGSFVSTLEACDPGLGQNVKSVQFRPVCNLQEQANLEPSDEVFQHLDIILQHCPNIERITSTMIAERKFIMKTLGTTKLQHLRQFPFPQDRYLLALSRGHYASLALNHEHSFTELSLVAGSREPIFTKLMQRLPDFKMLKRLKLYGSSQLPFSINDLDNLLNMLTPIDRSLEIVIHDLSISPDRTPEVISNNNITTLRISNSQLSAYPIAYLEKKLKGLKKLEVITRTTIFPRSQTEEQYTEWWNCMKDLCQRLDYYNISIDGHEDHLRELECWIGLMNASPKHDQEQKAGPIEFVMHVNRSDTTKKAHAVQMKKGGSCVNLFRSCSSFTMALDHIFRHVQSLSPNTIKLLGVNASSQKDLAFERENVEGKSLEAFNHVISLTSKHPAPVIHLDRMILLAPLLTLQMKQPRVRELKFTNSVFDSTTFSTMSPQLPEIDTLIFKGCFVKHDSHARFDIEIPETKLGHLELDLSHIDDKRPIGNLKIHLFTASEEKIIYRYIEGVRTRQETETSANAKSLFCVVIKCKELKSWEVSGIKLDHNQQWKNIVKSLRH